MRGTVRSLLVSLLLGCPGLAEAGLRDYLKAYRPGVEWGLRGGSADLNYEASQAEPLPGGCRSKDDEPGRMSCSTSLTESEGSPFSLVIQQAFKRQGWFYADADLGFSLFTLDGRIPRPEEGDEADSEIASGDSSIAQPLQRAVLHLYGINSKAYIVLGLTPPSVLPDLLLYWGLGKHFAMGNMKIEEKRQNITVDSTITYLQLEVVWWRFGDGSLSSYLAFENNTSAKKIFNGSVGDYSQLSIRPAKNSIGLLKLIFPWKI